MSTTVQMLQTTSATTQRSLLRDWKVVWTAVAIMIAALLVCTLPPASSYGNPQAMPVWIAGGL
jgi:hypothetical protein